MDQEVIDIILNAKTQEAEKARLKLEALGNQVKNLAAQLDAGTISQAQFEKGFAKLDQRIDGTKAKLKSLEGQIAGVGGKLSGASRAGAASRAGLLGANMAQDAIQGGNPAYAINNLLGAANDSGIKALAGEALAAAGGLRVVVAALGTLAAAATAAYAVLDGGLKQNKLGWSDLGDVVDKMAGGSFSHAKEVIGEGISSITGDIGEMIGAITETTIGWNSAAQAVRSHKDEVERDTAALLDFLQASKEIKNVSSEKQKEDEAYGKQFGEEAAGMDPKGVQGLIKRMARAQAGAKADELVEVETEDLDKHGKPTGSSSTKKITRAQQAEMALTRDFASAIRGDKDAQAGIRKRLGLMGEDASDLGDRESNKKADAYYDKQEADGKSDQAERENKARQDKEEADRKEQIDSDEYYRKQDEEDQNRRYEYEQKNKEADGQRAMKGVGLDSRVDEALLRAAIAAGGKTGVASDIVGKAISKELQEEGVDVGVADKLGREKAEERAASLGDEINDRLLNPNLKGPERIASVDFARTAESAGADKLQNSVDRMKDSLAELVRLTQRGPRLAP